VKLHPLRFFCPEQAFDVSGRFSHEFLVQQGPFSSLSRFSRVLSDAGFWPKPNWNPETRISNVEQEISNDEVESLLLFPSAFVVRYSMFCGSLLNL
jgi:hypothetical protein